MQPLWRPGEESGQNQPMSVFPTGRSRGVTGLGAGLCLLAFGLATLLARAEPGVPS